MTASLSQQLKDITLKLQEALLHFEASPLCLTTLSRETEDLMVALRQNPTEIQPEDKKNLEECIHMLRILEQKMSDRLNEWVFSMHLAK